MNKIVKTQTDKSSILYLDAKLENLSLNAESTCPIANVKKIPDFSVQTQCPFHKTVHETTNGKGEKHEINFKNDQQKTTEDLIKDIGGDRIRQMTTRFYAHLFKDQTISEFLFENDCAAAHGQRLGDWIIEFMGGEGTPWTDSGRHGMRQYSHFRAWNSSRRDKKDQGLRFKLDDCRIWMRLMFWSAREVGLDEHSAFMHWYVSFIQRFIGIYERNAPPYTKKDSRWSLSDKNIKEYVSNGFLMKDIARIGRRY